MLSRAAKATYYRVAGPLMWANGKRYRAFAAPKPEADRKVQLGPGQKYHLPGWLNVDANAFTAKCEVWADLRNKLPFATNSIRCCYSHHVVEHLPDLWRHFRDVYRCLQPGGVYRVGGPNGDSAIAAFSAGKSDWFASFPDDRASLGGRFENFIFCRQEHLTILTESYLREIAESVGFTEIERCLPTKETRFPELFDECLAQEYESDFDLPHTLLLEMVKPA